MGTEKLKHKITLQNRVSTQNPIGGRSESYIDVTTIRARCVQSGGTMYMAGGESHKESDCVFEIRYNTIPQSDMYVLFNNARYLIQAVNDLDGNHKWMQITCKLER